MTNPQPFALLECVGQLQEKDQVFLRRFLAKNEKLRTEADLVENLFSIFAAHPPDAHCSALRFDASKPLSVDELAIRRAYRLVTRKPFEPETFLHRSFSVELVRQLTHAFGTYEHFLNAIRAGTKLYYPPFAYAAWVYGLVPVDRVFAGSPRVHKKPWPKPRKKRTRPRTRARKKA